VFYSERERRNDAVYAEHKEALARGERRVLRKTATGELHTFGLARDEYRVAKIRKARGAPKPGSS
jgi:hypothetical protein